MTEDDKSVPPATPADERRQARLARIEAEQAHGEQLIAHYGRETPRPRFAVVGALSPNVGGGDR